MIERDEATDKTELDVLSLTLAKPKSRQGQPSGIANYHTAPYNSLIADIVPMPDPSFPDLSPSHGFPSAVQTLIGVDQKPSFSPLIHPNQEAYWRSRLHGHEINSLLESLTFHAEPLPPLRQRDEQALEDIFDDAQIEEILIDICVRLRQLYPEPCWDEDPFDFLQGYI